MRHITIRKGDIDTTPIYEEVYGELHTGKFDTSGDEARAVFEGDSIRFFNPLHGKLKGIVVWDETMLAFYVDCIKAYLPLSECSFLEIISTPLKYSSRIL